MPSLTVHSSADDKERLKEEATAATAPLPHRGAAVIAPSPAAAASGQTIPSPEEGSGHGTRRILLVEDHEPTRSSLTALLQRRGYSVVAVGTCSEALREAFETRFDLVLSDIGLPDGDGFELMRQLGNVYGLKGIALTGYGMEEDVIRSQAAGFLAHLTKPVEFKALDRSLRAVFGGN